MQLTPFAISGLFIVATNLPLLCFILFKGKTRVAYIYAMEMLCVTLWGIGTFLGGYNQDYSSASIIWKLAYSPVLFIPAFSLHTITLLTGKRLRVCTILVYMQALFFLMITWSGKMFSDVTLVFNSFYYPNGTTFYTISFAIWMAIICLAHIELFEYYKKIYTKQIFLFFIATAMGFGGGITNFLPGFGIYIYPYGNYLIGLYPLFITYAILKHQLLDIEIVIKKSIAYSLSLAFISIIYLSIVVFLEKALQQIIGYHSMAISIFTAFVVGLLFFPLRNRIQHSIDRIFFHGTQVEIAQENERLRQELTQTEKLKAVATLASGMAHEIKNPLTAIKTFAEFLPLKKHDPEFLEKFSKIVGNEVGRIDGLVHQLLEFAKPSPPVFVKTDIHKLLDDTLDFLNSKFVQHKINIIKDYINTDDHRSGTDGHRLGENLSLNIDPNQIRQVFLNIFLNAIEAMGAGGELTIQTTDQRPETRDQKLEKSLVSSLESKVCSDYLKIAITDTGCGIDKKDLSHIFDPFFSKKDGGTGLGLAIVHGIIKEHGGKITVESTVGVGTTFVVEMPIAKKVIG